MGDTFREHAHVVRLRVARKAHRCDLARDASWSHPCSGIQPGDFYAHSTVYPGHDVVNVETPRVDRCCLNCARGYSGALGDAAAAASAAPVPAAEEQR